MFLDKRLTKRKNNDAEIGANEATQMASEHCWLLEFAFKNETIASPNPTQEILDALVKCGLPQSVRQDVHTILNELYVNALDYGVLGMGEHPKASITHFDAFQIERQKRLDKMASQNAQINAWIKINCCLNIADRPELEITVADSGDGYFELSDQFNSNLPRNVALDEYIDNTSCKGRGLALVKALVSDFRFVGHSNQVKVIYRC